MTWNACAWKACGYHGGVLQQAELARGECFLCDDFAPLWQAVPVRCHHLIPLGLAEALLQQGQCTLLQEDCLLQKQAAHMWKDMMLHLCNGCLRACSLEENKPPSHFLIEDWLVEITRVARITKQNP